ncbi:unnamed protein product [Lepeophtheirus salmonis]|uniref:(salmon louse) hypothetical protein n=1 Tax=Lepeophtheirus salmonis TaxID=72036 RepID=A0A7R8CSH3_LEPSM|nr:unnamed protein product [Lepeophtheirus salmonis]CAF2916911.1 unnamed protein product [Lepeophtheirus salmonis]
MKKVLPHLTLAELKTVCLLMDVATSNEELVGKRKSYLVQILKEHLRPWKSSLLSILRGIASAKRRFCRSTLCSRTLLQISLLLMQCSVRRRFDSLSTRPRQSPPYIWSHIAVFGAIKILICGPVYLQLSLKSSTLKTPTFLITDFEQPILGSHAATINIKDEVLPHYLGDCPAPVTFEDKVKKELEKIKPAKWVSPIVSVSNTSIPQTSSVVQPIH